MDYLTKQLVFVLTIFAVLFVVGLGVVPWLVTGYVMYLVISVGALATAAAVLGLIAGVFWLAGKIFPDE